MRTLYVSDLDGTLLRGDQRISAFSIEILNRVMDTGIAFSLCTARTVTGIEVLGLDALHFRLPLILMNGAMLYDYIEKRIVQSCPIDTETVSTVLEICAAEGKFPFVYRVLEGIVHVFATNFTSAGEREIYQKRNQAFPGLFHMVRSYDRAPALYFSMQDTRERLERLQQHLKGLPDVGSAMYEDKYRKDNWYLEIFSADAGKDKGALRLKEKADAQRMVAFGDNLNDLPLFAEADVACCVSNGLDAAKKAADVQIGSNHEDGVANYLKKVLDGTFAL